MNSSQNETSAAKEIDAIIKKLDDWRGKKLSEIRDLIKEADPDIQEEVKWKKPTNPDGIPVWSHDGMICTGETYKNHLRLTFAKGKLLKVKNNILNAYRAIIIHEEDIINKTDFKNLIIAAVELNHKKQT